MPELEQVRMDKQTDIEGSEASNLAKGMLIISELLAHKTPLQENASVGIKRYTKEFSIGWGE